MRPHPGLWDDFPDFDQHLLASATSDAAVAVDAWLAGREPEFECR